jgi:hypothetical protein
MKSMWMRVGGGLCVGLVGALVGSMVAACSSSSGKEGPEGGIFTDSGHNGEAGEGGQTCTTGGNVITDGKGHTLKAFCAPPDPGPNAIYVSASGETLSLVGFQYPPAEPPDDTWMIDGWNFKLDAYITVFTAVTIWSDPDESPSDQSKHGAQIAQLNGPFVVDLHKGGPLQGQGGIGEEATPIGVIAASQLGACSSIGS